MRTRLDEVASVLNWYGVVAPGQAGWPAFFQVRKELRAVLGAHLRRETLPTSTPEFEDLATSVRQIELSISAVTEADLEQADHELSEVFGDDWREQDLLGDADDDPQGPTGGTGSDDAC